MSCSLDLRLKKPFYSPWGRTSRSCPFSPESPGSRDRSLRAKCSRGGVSGQRDQSLRPGKPPARVSGESLRPHYWGERHPSKRRAGDLGRSLRSQTQSLRCEHTGVSGLETRSLRLRQDINRASFRSSPKTEIRLRQMVRYLSIDNKHPKIDFTRKCSFTGYRVFCGAVQVVAGQIQKHIPDNICGMSIRICLASDPHRCRKWKLGFI
jgi:hypothetical protein